MGFVNKERGDNMKKLGKKINPIADSIEAYACRCSSCSCSSGCGCYCVPFWGESSGGNVMATNGAYSGDNSSDSYSNNYSK